MDTRKYLAELLGTFLFMTIGYARWLRSARRRRRPGCSSCRSRSASACWPRSSPFGPHLGRAFQPGRDGRRWCSTAGRRRSTPSATSSPRSSAPSGPRRSSWCVSQQSAVAAGVTKPGGGITDIGALILEVVLTAGFVLVILASTKRAPALAPLAIPLTLVAIHFASATLYGRVGQPGPLDRLGARRWRPDRAVDLPRRPDHRRRQSAGASIGRWTARRPDDLAGRVDA